MISPNGFVTELVTFLEMFTLKKKMKKERFLGVEGENNRFYFQYLLVLFKMLDSVKPPNI